ncbi:MAG: acyltransferase [Ramlibacter sp.]|nr:acyltransferase [Ramlibacter sp.]
MLGWDLLRGLCALTVMAYHLLGWQDIAHLSPLGTYGVYLFFLLSGASMAYVYDADRVATWGGAWRFLVTRWFRLAPLYLVACLVFLAMLAARNGFWASEIPFRLALNASFAFGLYDPTTWALAVGGWSLGIEFVFYLAFPFLMQAARTRAGRWVTLAALVLLQAGWVLSTVGQEGLATAGVAYHQVPGFAGWFFAGCLIGQARREQGAWRGRGLAWTTGVFAWGGLGLLLVVAAGPTPGQELLGWRGLMIPLACALVVWVSAQVRVERPFALALADLLGRLTYGVYLIHPLVYFGFAWFVWPGAQAAVAGQQALGLGIALAAGWVTCVLATQGFRWIEAPGQRLAKRLLARPKSPLHPRH